MPTNATIAKNLKKYFYSGIGFASHASELFQKSMDEYVKTGRVSEKDGKKIIDDTFKKIDEQRAKLEARYNEAIHKFVSRSAAEIAGLQKKVEQLEDQLKAKGTHAGGSAARAASEPRSASRSVSRKAVRPAKKAMPARKK
jgi:polyhydroxyalkanoate synthesis regulator phasin